MRVLGNLDKYLEHQNKGFLPKELEQFRHGVRWPVDLENVPFAFGCVHLEEYCLPSKSVETHHGIDIIASPGTEVFAPEDCELLLAVKEERIGKEKADLIIQGSETRIIYFLGHLDYDSFPEKIKNMVRSGSHQNFDYLNSFSIEKDEILGEVGEWPFKRLAYSGSENLSLAEEVLGDYDHHLHISTTFLPENKINKFHLFDWKNEFNPYLIFKRLKG